MPAGTCSFPGCDAPVPPRPGPGRPRAYCDDPKHNPVSRHRAERSPAQPRPAAEPPVIDEATVARIRAAEAARIAAELDAHAARRERDAALAMRDLAVDELTAVRAELDAARAEAAETVSRMRADYDRAIARMAAVADAEIERAIVAHTFAADRPRRASAS
ncbi:hypothetical protein IU501_22895 [Nocardia otitidiscaviarum]|uniref:hypothetical protein n=1 Tax=Nocardia otitidiscaviarum TaxID=1823 RepID=UPI0004A78176|nr:hypothetical protein [Nocardia otitidiscaviarum]MBF6135842.1 hypothetical protein [Nocardia otitidiscaviarum]